MTWIGVVFGIVVGVVLVLVALLFAVRRAAAPGIDPTQLTLQPALIGQLRELIAQDQKIMAVKLLRDTNPGLSLLTAKNIVDRLAAAGPPGTTPRPPGLSDSAAQYVPDTVPSSSQVPFDVELEVRQLKLQGQPISAITLVREHTGMELKQAKDYVDGLD